MRRAPEARLGILLSGRGSNFLALHGAVDDGRLPASIAVVVSNVAAAPGLARAQDLGLRAEAIPHEDFSSREAHEEAVLDVLADESVDWVCLAGYMRLLSARFVAGYRGRIVNIHPSLLPAFPGLDAQRQAWDYGVKVAGCTVHFVDEGLDSGPIVLQRAIGVADDDSEESLAGRILEQEHRAYPEALRRLLAESWELRGRRLIFDEREG